MARLTAWLVTLVGLLWLAFMFGWVPSPIEGWTGWLVGLAFFVVGLGKLMRNYGGKRR